MKAAVVVENQKIECQEIDIPEVSENDVLIEVYYTGICGSDIPRVWNNGAHSYPIILGHEFSGIVKKIGKNVSNINIDDHVVGVPLIPCMECTDCKNGNFSLCKHYSFVGSRRSGSMVEYISLPKDNVFVIDKNIDLEEAAFFEPSTIALHGINLVPLRKDSNVLVLGGGNIGAFVIQWLKILGVENITVIGRDKERLQNNLEYGAHNIVSTLDDDYKEQLASITNNRGFDFVFETAGSNSMIHLSFEMVANKGHICYIGTPTEDLTFSVKEWETINRKECNLVGSWMSYSNPWPGTEWQMTKEKFSSGDLKIYPSMIFEEYDIEDCDKAFELYKDNKKVKGKVFIVSKKK